MSNKILSASDEKLPVDLASAKGGESNEIQIKKSNSKRVANSVKVTLPKEINGPTGLEPTRYGDWESKGRCYDF